MTYQERRAVVSLIGTLLIPALYSAFMAPRYPVGEAVAHEVLRFWGLFFLILIPVSIVARIVIHIVFSIVNTVATREDEPQVTDERDQLIELKAIRNSAYVFGIGFMVAMVPLVMGLSPSAMFIALLAAGVLAELVSDLSKFYFYRRGF